MMGARGKAPTHPGLRTMDKVEVDDNGCWIFTGAINRKSGYGQIFNSRVARPVIVTAHVATWTYFEGPVPAGLQLDHLCRVRACCNPGHLEPVTPRENTRRGMAPRVLLSVANVCEQGHPLTPENTYVNPASGYRRCRICRREYNRAYSREWKRRRRAA